MKNPATGVFPFLNYANRYDIWEYLPMDQGGRLVQLQLIASEKDKDITTALRKKSFFAPWGNPIRWDALESTQMEKSVWLNRWYYLPSFARRYLVTGKRKYLDDLLKLFRQWTRDNPVPADLKKYFAGGKYNWRDMQIAWRTQNLIWCYFLGETGFSNDEKQELYESISDHARVLYEYFGNSPLHRNNHQSHGALAMLYSGALFPKLPLASMLRKRAVAILNHHLKRAFYPDGNSVELSPGYYPFFVSIFRDAMLLCEANGIKPPLQSRKRLKQFHDYLSVVSQPDGTMPPINDSSESDAPISLSILRELLDLNPAKPSSHYFPDSGHAVMRDKSTYLFVDAGPQMLWHWHGGKMGFHLWFGNRAMILDSGVSNYDEKLRVDWYCQPQAHNTLLVDGVGDYPRDSIDFRKEPLAACRVMHWESNDRYDRIAMIHDGFAKRAKPVRWLRNIILIKSMCALIIDEIESDSVHEYQLPFHFPPGKLQWNRKAKSFRTTFAKQNLLLIPVDPDAFDSCDITPGWINQRGQSIPAPVANYRAKRNGIVASTCVVPIQGNQQPDVSMRQTLHVEMITLKARIGNKSIELNIPRLRTISSNKSQSRRQRHKN